MHGADDVRMMYVERGYAFLSFLHTNLFYSRNANMYRGP